MSSSIAASRPEVRIFTATGELRKADRRSAACLDESRVKHHHRPNPLTVDPTEAQRILEHFVKFLCDGREALTQEWMSSVHRNGRLQTSERLTAEELRQHLPALFDDLADVLQSPANRGVQIRADESARRHGHRRFGQNYRLSELIQEISVIRTLVVAQVLAFEEQTPEFQGMVKRVALQRLHGFFDNLMADAAEQFTQDQQGGLRQDLSTARDDTVRERDERHGAETNLRKAESETKQLRDVDAGRLRLLQTVAHELRNSLNANQILVHSLEGEENAKSRTEFFSMLERNINHMEALLKDLLTYAIVLDEPKYLRSEAISIPELCEDLVATYAPLAEAKGLQMSAERDPALTRVISHRTKIIQIVSNLLSNAIKYTSTGSVRLSFRGTDAAHWSVAVEDTGPGIISEEREQIFTEFHRLRGTSHMEGTGLGLALVKRLTELLGGEVRLDSHVGRGSLFEVILPREAKEIA